MSESELEGALRKEIELPFNEALRLRDSGDLAAAVEIMRALSQQHPSVSVIHLMLGDILDKQGDLESAIGSFKVAVELSPKSKNQSLNLIESLYQLGRMEELCDELVRFRATGRSSPEHEGIAEELREKGLLADGPGTKADEAAED